MPQLSEEFDGAAYVPDQFDIQMGREQEARKKMRGARTEANLARSQSVKDYKAKRAAERAGNA